MSTFFCMACQKDRPLEGSKKLARGKIIIRRCAVCLEKSKQRGQAK